MARAIRPLRPHQIEAVDAIVRGLDIPPGGVPAAGIRGQVHSACGTGKTTMAAAAARRLVPRGRTIVMVPTLDLLTQTAREWQALGHTGPSVAVARLEDDTALWTMNIRTTTNPVQLALWHGQGPVTVYATYASLPVLVEAFVGSYGQRLGPVDLLVVDEAHRTSGSMGKAWADVHAQGLVPAARRLYMTATPRIWQERPNREVAEGRRDPLPEEQAASMADTAIFGKVLWKLSLASAITRGLLARYRIIVMEITDPTLTRERLYGEERLSEEVRGQRMAALQAGLIRTMTEHDLSSTITFHHRTREANAFVAGLPRVVRRLHTHDPGQYPAKVWADWLCGDHDPGHRQEVLRQLRATALPAVLSNSKVLNEGVDAPSVDSVALLDPKGAPHDIVQAIGRALRQKPNQGKMASLVVPVFLQPGTPPNSRDYRPLTRVLRGLRAHDAEAVEMLAIPQENRERMVDPSFPLGETPEDEDGEDPRFLLRISTRQDPGFIADLVRFDVMDIERDDWQRGHAALRAFVGREGHAQVPYGHIEETGQFPLGRWVSEQRRAFGAGEMKARRAEDLERLGMVWDVPDAAWQANLAAARAYYEEHATLAAPRGAVALGRPVGQFLANSRRPEALERFPERAAALAAIDPDWNAPWSPTWQRHYAALRELIGDEPEGAAAAVPPGVTVYGLDVGKWAAQQTQRKTWDGLQEGQRERLEDLGVRPGPAAPSRAPVPAQRRLTAFDKGVAAMRAWRAREGDTPPSRAHVEHVVIDGQEHAIKLGIWRSNTRSRKAGLSEKQRAVLDELGV
ncbi:DEAD/DEAH box helicase [Streptomyces sp. SM12]|uniref:DEAD/DEAH box helicase n=2 Tax=Streptomyces TaxID=1883 RepID=UPI000CD4BD05|nr:DEAD/DEAH box helicase [Streptomyces sp. SM12]